MATRWAGVLLLASACTQQLDFGPESASNKDGAPSTPDPQEPNSGGPPAPWVGCSDPVLQEQVLEFDLPRAVFVVERSSSMLQPFGSHNRLEAAAASLSKVMANRRLEVGLAQYPGPFCESDGCCASPAFLTPLVDRDLLARRIRCEGFPPSCLETHASAPLDAALKELRALFIAFTPRGSSRAAIVIADGDPECGAGDSSECEAAVGRAASLLQEFGARTFVVPVGSDASASACLPRVAEAGGTLGAGETLSVALSDLALEAGLNKAIGSVEEGFCRAKLRFSPLQPESLRVFVDGVEVLRADRAPQEPSTFVLDATSKVEIRLQGQVCEALKRQPADVQVYQSCCPGSPRAPGWPDCR